MENTNTTTENASESENFPLGNFAQKENPEEEARESAETIEKPEREEGEGPQAEQPKEKDTAVAEEKLESSVQSVDGTQIEQIVRKVVEEKLAKVFGKPKEPPRKNALAEELSSEDHLRLGYGAKSPHI